MLLRKLLPLPDLRSCKRLLCVQPHPDDNEVGAGAAIARLARSGCEVFFLTATDGSLGTLDPALSAEALAETRRAEIEKSAAILGVRRCLSLELPDGSFLDEELLCRRITAAIREIRPDFVATCDPFLPYEAHPDHRRVGMAALEACVFSPFPRFEAPSLNGGAADPPWTVPAVALYTTASPNFFLDVTETWAAKFEALAAHASQFPPEALAQLRPYFELKGFQHELRAGRPLGALLGKRRAEAFKVLPTMCIHSFVDAAAL